MGIIIIIVISNIGRYKPYLNRAYGIGRSIATNFLFLVGQNMCLNDPADTVPPVKEG